MKNLKVITANINNNVDLEANLKEYGDAMMTLYNRYSFVRFSMNYYTFHEMLREDNKKNAEFNRLSDKVDAITASFINGGTDYETFVVQLDEIRATIIKYMDVVTSYVDKFTLYEYVLNRVEARFSEEEFDDDYYNSRFTNDIMHYILSDKDNAAINSRISEVVRQMPVRITKSRFFDLLKDALMLYRGAQVESVDDFIYVLRTVATVDRPDNFEEFFPDLYEIYNKLSNANYKELDKTSYDNLLAGLTFAIEEVQGLTDKFVNLVELVNDLYTIVLSMPYAQIDADEMELFKKIITGVIEDDEDEFDLFIKLEGKQEDAYLKLSQNDYIIEQLDEELQKLLPCMTQLKTITKLTSGNYFVPLNKEENPELIADEAYILNVLDSFAKELKDIFDKNTNLVNRAIMAAVLSSLPVFFNNIDEIQAYINVALVQCRDKAEQIACVKVMKMIMEQ